MLIGSRRSSSSGNGAVTVVGGSVRLESTGGAVLMPLNGGVVATLALTVLGIPAGSVRVPLTGTTLTELPGGAVEPATFGGVDAPASFPPPRGRLTAGCVCGSLEGPSGSPERGAVSELPDERPDVTGDRSVIGGWRTLTGGFFWLAGGSGDCCVIGWLRGRLSGPRWLAGNVVASRDERVSAPESIDRGPVSCTRGPDVLGGVIPGVDCDAIAPTPANEPADEPADEPR
ncbi:MAG: hypothetical protein L6Q76_33235 [Polyangiaceae bacterium]|nr:hypothetical protein [Polyangiaceae bacterium]